MPEFKASTNKTQKVKLNSSIELVRWSRSSAAAGTNVGIEVYTTFVGNDSDISLEISDASGKKFDTRKGKVYGNRFWTSITVPENAKDELYAEVKLSKHGLNSKSRPLYIMPPFILKNLKWSKSEVRRGDILKITADVIGVPDAAEAVIEIFEQISERSSELITDIPASVKKSKIEIEWEFQYPGDVGEIPASGEGSAKYFWPEFFFRVKINNVKADSEKIKFFDYAEFQLLDAFQEPVADLDYILHLPDGTERTGKTDSGGNVHEKDLPPGKIKIEIKDLENITVR